MSAIHLFQCTLISSSIFIPDGTLENQGQMIGLGNKNVFF